MSIGHNHNSYSFLVLRYALLLFFLTIFSGYFLFAEGTKELAPNSSDVTALYTNRNTFGAFAAYGGPTDTRLNIHIADPANEQVYLGFSQRMSTSNGSDGVFLNTTYYFRIIDPDGNIVYGPQSINSTNANTNTWALASAGPSPVVGPGGYSPFTYVPAAGVTAGDFYVEFSTNANNSSSGNSNLSIKFWDITVATRTSPTAINGRIWSQRWAFRSPSVSQGSDPTYGFFDREFTGKIYTYSDNGFVSEVDFDGSGFRGLTFNLAFNEDGTEAETNLVESRKSDLSANTTSGQFKLFINNPDELVYPTGVFGEIDAAPFVKYCPGDTLCISYAVTEVGQVEILLDFDTGSGAGIYDLGTADVLLLENVVKLPGETAPLERCVEWDGNDGLGNAVSLTNAVSVYFSYFQGVVHFPVYDVEYLTAGLQINPIRPSVASGFVVKPHFDDSKINQVRLAGANQIELDGCIMPCHNWTNFDFGNINTINTWWFMNDESQSTYIIPNCCPIAECIPLEVVRFRSQ